MGRSRSGWAEIRGSSATELSLSACRGEPGRRPPEHRYQCHRQGPDGGGQGHMESDDAPWELQAVLDLADRHLDDEDDEHAEGKPEEPRRELPSGSEIAEYEEEGGPEDGRHTDVDPK